MWDEAAEDGGQCVVVNRAFVEGYLRAGLAYQNLGNLDAALDFVKRGLGVEPGNADLEKLSLEIEKKMMAMDLKDWTVRRWQLYLEGKTEIRSLRPPSSC
jgi:tetratricopeptide (TPR) repeat protein